MVSQHPHVQAQECYQRGLLRLRRNQTVEALADFQLAVRFDPDLAEAHLEIARLRVEREPTLALESLEAVIRLWPDRADGYALRGAVLGKTNHLEEALIDLARATQIDPTLPQPYHDRAVILAQQMRHPEACEQFTLALERNPQSAASFFGRGCALAAQKLYERALPDLTEAIRIEPRHARFFYSRGLTHARMKNHELAVADYAQVLRLEPDHKEVLVERAYSLVALNRNDEAMRDLNKAIGRGGPRVAAACALRSTLAFQAGKLDQAVADMERCVKLEPNNLAAMTTLAALNGELGNVDRALEISNLAVERYPNEPQAYLGRGTTHQGRNEWEKALVDLSHAIHLDPSSASAYTFRGNCYRRMHRYADAVADYRKVVELEPNDIRVLNQLAWLLVSCPDDAVRNGAEAKRLAERACELGGKLPDPINVDTLAAAHAALGDFARAVELLEEAVSRCPRDRVDELRRHLSDFRAGKPLREP